MNFPGGAAAAAADAASAVKLKASVPLATVMNLRRLGFGTSVLAFLVIADLSAKKFRAYAHHRRALGNGVLEVVTHAHAQVFEPGAPDLVPAHFFEDLARAGEGLADRLLVGVERGHGHQAHEL